MVHSFKNGNALSSENGLFANDTEHRSLSLELAYIHSSNWGFSIGAATPFYGRNILNGTMFQLGVIYKAVTSANSE